MNRFILVLTALVLLVASCSKVKPPEVVRVEIIRNQLPYITRVYSSVSMAGYKPGDILKVTASPYADIKPGDHIFAWYTNQPRPVFHLAVRKVFSEMPPHNRWLVHGDQNQYPDQELLTEETYIGKWDKVAQ